METSGSIFKNKALQASQDYNYLKQNGLKFVQGYSGNEWTDYNSHDPGVTILEQFCYGITDLGYKIDFPIEDLLVEDSDGRINWKKNSFFSPALVFSSHPFTILDYRKLLIDTFPEIQNCWLYLVNDDGKEEKINGIYKVEVLPSLAFQKELVDSEDASEKFIHRLENFLALNRNLGESFDQVILLKPSPIYLRVNVEAASEIDPDQLMAEILFGLDVHFYHPVAFSNFEELQQEGKRPEEIFAGPRLSRGFIRDSELKDRSDVVYAEKLLQLISRIQGVNKCWGLKIDKEGIAKKIQLPLHTFASINTESEDFDSVYETIRIYSNGNLLRFNKMRVSDILLDLWSKKFRVYKVDVFRETYWKEFLKGKFRKIGEYKSVQHLFPRIYGLGKEGISKHESPERHAKVRQLKGYLMLMEKHLANFLAQLSHLPDFFDSDVQQTQSTYFSQDYETKVGPDELEIKSKLIPGFDKNGINPQTGESRISWLKRKNRVLDHLLARFGEEIQESPFQLSQKLNLLGNEEEMLAAILLQKSRFLQAISELTYGKQKAVFDSSLGEYSSSTLEQILHLILGIKQKEESLIPSFLKKRKSDFTSDTSSSYVSAKRSFQDLMKDFRLLSKSEKMFPQLADIEDFDYALGKIGLKDLFSKTVDPDSYWISKKKSRFGNMEVIFQKSDSQWVGIWEGKDEKQAYEAIAHHIQNFRILNAYSEGMILIDHILLKPMLEGSQFGFVLLDEWGNPTFKSPWINSEEARREQLDKFNQAALSKESYQMRSGNLSLMGADDELLGIYQSEETKDLESIYHSTSSLSQLMMGDGEISGILALQEVEKLRLKGTLYDKDKGTYRQRTVIFTRRLEDGREVREDFFDLKASLILPDWPARFQDSNFRFFLANEIRERVPSHMEVSISWLNFFDFQTFENLHKHWKDQKSKAKRKKKYVNSAYSLYEFLHKLKGGKNG